MDRLGIRTHSSSRRALARAQRYFEQAIAKDTSYALAYAGLSDTYGHRSVFGFALPNESFPLAKRYAAKALFLNHVLVNPPVDRNKPVHEVADVYLHVVRETDAGAIVSGAKISRAPPAHATFVAQNSP